MNVDQMTTTDLLALTRRLRPPRREQGRGFAVVADEVRKLAHAHLVRRRDRRMIADVKESSGRSQETMDEAMNQVKHGLALAEQGGESIASRSATALCAWCRWWSEYFAGAERTNVASDDIALNVERIAQSASGNAQAARQVAQASSSRSRSDQ